MTPAGDVQKSCQEGAEQGTRTELHELKNLGPDAEGGGGGHGHRKGSSLRLGYSSLDRVRLCYGDVGRREDYQVK